MKKMPSLFVREFENSKVVKCLNKVTEGCEWVLNGEGVPTIKLDGTCCLIQDGKIYKRYDAKKGKKPPVGAIPCQENPDPITGHFPHWVLCDEDNPADKYHIKAFKEKDNWENGTYELIGEHIQGNPYHMKGEILVKHGVEEIDDFPRTYNRIKTFLTKNNIEGIVYHRENGDMCKIKRTDFGLNWGSHN